MVNNGFAIWKSKEESEKLFQLTTVKDLKEGFVFHPFDAARNNVLYFEESEKGFDKSTTFELLTSSTLYQESKENYVAKVHQVKEIIKQGLFDKIAISSAFDVPIGNISPLEIFNLYKNNFKTAYKHLVYVPNKICSIGVSPEILLKKLATSIETVALAATKKANDLTAWNQKEIEEQSIISEYIKQQLGGVTSQLNVEKTTDLLAGNIKHICTSFKGKSEESWKVLAHALHPTPAVGSMPKQNGVATIFEIEDYDRKYYAGYLGEFGEKLTELVVNIRCFELFTNKIRYYVGAGITKDSNPEAEWLEYLRKLANLKRPLGLK